MDIDLIELRDLSFFDPQFTVTGEPRAHVDFAGLKTLCFNTGTQCNLACSHCYIESSPSNNLLSYISLTEVQGFLNEVQNNDYGTEEIGLTGGEPFMNPDIIPIMAEILRRGFKLLVLTNAMKPLQNHSRALLQLKRLYGPQITIRVSMDHYQPERHEQERGPKSWQPMLDGLLWLQSNTFRLHIAGRAKYIDVDQWTENRGETAGKTAQASMRDGYAQVFKQHGLKVDAHDPQ
ncbi:radical SAM protein [Porticoccaceae bacterium]|nr:radical SAM protein [Porticoccaceae bacterium]